MLATTPFSPTKVECAVHSGQFMISKLDDSDSEEETPFLPLIPHKSTSGSVSGEVTRYTGLGLASSSRGTDVSDVDVGALSPAAVSGVNQGCGGYDFGKAACSSANYAFYGGQMPASFSIDDSLTKLLECLTIAYPGKITSPKWNQFRGVKLVLKDKIRLNNIIWREYHMQYVKKKTPQVVQFAAPLTENHLKPEAVVMEGKYWKRRITTICNEYKRWRVFFKTQLKAQDDSSRLPYTHKELLDMVAKQDVRRLPNKCQSPAPGLDDIMIDFDFDLFLDQPLAFPNPRDLCQLGNADIMQPGLIQLQPNLEDFMDINQTILQTSLASYMASNHAFGSTTYASQSNSSYGLFSSAGGTETNDFFTSYGGQQSSQQQNHLLPMKMDVSGNMGGQSALSVDFGQDDCNFLSTLAEEDCNDSLFLQPSGPFTQTVRDQSYSTMDSSEPLNPSASSNKAMFRQMHHLQPIQRRSDDTPNLRSVLMQPVMRDSIQNSSPLAPRDSSFSSRSFPTQQFCKQDSYHNSYQEPQQQQRPEYKPLFKTPPQPLFQQSNQPQTNYIFTSATSNKIPTIPKQQTPPQRFTPPNLIQAPLFTTNPQSPTPTFDVPTHIPGFRLIAPSPSTNRSTVQHQNPRCTNTSSILKHPQSNQSVTSRSKQKRQLTFGQSKDASSNRKQQSYPPPVSSGHVQPSSSSLQTHPIAPRIPQTPSDVTNWAHSTFPQTNPTPSLSFTSSPPGQQTQPSPPDCQKLLAIINAARTSKLPDTPTLSPPFASNPTPASAKPTGSNSTSRCDNQNSYRFSSSLIASALQHQSSPRLDVPQGHTSGATFRRYSDTTMQYHAADRRNSEENANSGYMDVETTVLVNDQCQPTSDKMRLLTDSSSNQSSQVSRLAYPIPSTSESPQLPHRQAHPEHHRHHSSGDTSSSQDSFSGPLFRPPLTLTAPSSSFYTPTSANLGNVGNNSDYIRKTSINATLNRLQAQISELSGGCHSSRISKAKLLFRSADQIRRLRSQIVSRDEEIEQVKAEIESLTNHISSCCSQLPATGVAVSRQRASQGREWFDAYVRASTLRNYKFYIFSLIISDLFDSYNTRISPNTSDSFTSSVSSWLEQQCALVKLRPLGWQALRQLSTSTSILTDPSKVPEQAQQAVSRATNRTQTSSLRNFLSSGHTRHRPSDEQEEESDSESPYWQFS